MMGLLVIIAQSEVNGDVIYKITPLIAQRLPMDGEKETRLHSDDQWCYQYH